MCCHAFRDNTPNDLVYPMPISSEPDVYFVWVSDEMKEKGRERERTVVITKFHILIIHLILWIILLWAYHKNRVNWIKWQSKSVHKTQLAFSSFVEGEKNKETTRTRKDFYHSKEKNVFFLSRAMEGNFAADMCLRFTRLTFEKLFKVD